MISLFGKQIRARQAVRLAVVTGVLAGIAGLAQAQMPTRTQVMAQRDGSGTLTFTVNVADTLGNPVSEGAVSFETAKGSLGSVFVHDGTATLTLTNPPQWARTVTAAYSGDTKFGGSSASTEVTPDDSSSLPGFTVTASPSSFTVTPGQTETLNLTITSQNGFSEAVNLSCSGLPGASACNFNPAVLTPPANSTTLSVMQITTEAASGVLSPSFMIPGFLALAGVVAIRRRNLVALRALGLAMLLGAGALGLTACNPRYSYEHYKPSPNYGTAAGSYTVVVSAYSSNGTTITQATSSDPSCSGAVCLAMTVQ